MVRLDVLVETLDGLNSSAWPGAHIFGPAWTAPRLPTTPIESYAYTSSALGVHPHVGAGRRPARWWRWASPAKPPHGCSASSNSQLHQHLERAQAPANPDHEHPRAAPMPTPFKIYGLSLMPAELVPIQSYAIVALLINRPGRFVVVDRIVRRSPQDALSGKGGDSRPHWR